MTTNMQIQHTGEQFDLFAGFRLPVVEPSKRPRPIRACSLRRVAAKVVQYTLDLRARAEEAAEDWADRWANRPVVHAVVDARATKMPETRAVPSIFDMACQIAAEKVIAEFMAQQLEPEPLPTKGQAFQDQAHTEVIREPGIIRCRRLHHTETQAWQEQEAARRARQRPPKPPKKAKTMGSKLIELVGVPDAA